MGQLGLYLAVVEFFVGFRECSGGLRWEVVVPSEDVIYVCIVYWIEVN